MLRQNTVFQKFPINAKSKLTLFGLNHVIHPSKWLKWMNAYWRLLFTQHFLLSNYVSWRVPLQFKSIILTTKKVNWCFLQYIFLYLKFCHVRKNFVNLHARFPSTLKHFYILPSSHFILCFLLGLACTDTFLLNLQPDFHIHLSVIC